VPIASFRATAIAAIRVLRSAVNSVKPEWDHTWGATARPISANVSASRTSRNER
jgi:hypothetical protein